MSLAFASPLAVPRGPSAATFDAASTSCIRAALPRKSFFGRATPARRSAAAAPALARFEGPSAMLRGKTVAITGCTRGIGAEFVRQLFGRGVERIIGLVRDPSTEGIKELQEQFGDKFECIKLDVGDEASIKAATAEVRGRTDRLDVLINCAGLWSRVSLGDVTTDHMVELFRVNAVGPMLVARELAPRLAAAAKAADATDVHSGLILNVTSKMGSIDDNTSGSSYAYRASKCALNIINKSLALDFAGEGVTSVLLHPGYVRTKMTNFQGLIDPNESVRGLLGVVEGLGYEDNGCWFDYRGTEIPW